MIEDVRIECDEGGFVLELSGDLARGCNEYLEDGLGRWLRLRLPQDAALALLAQARSEIGPWAAEMDTVRREFQAARFYIDGESVPGPSDPKSAGYHDRMADAADVARKREKGE